MHLKSKITIALLGLLVTTISFGQTKTPKEYLGVTGPIVFEKVSYHLSWSAHPADNYYKQEYLAKGDTVEKYKKLILLEVLFGKTTLKDIVESKVAELKKLKASNPVVNYELFENGGEIMLDFLLSENTADGKYLNIIERNVYRYKSVIDKNGQNGVLLFGVSERAYGDDIDKFLPNLKAHRNELISSVGAYNIPAVTIEK